MSVCQWVCQGIGIDVDRIKDRIDTKKCVAFLKNQLSDPNIKEEGFDIDDFLYGNPYSHLGELLCDCEDGDLMGYDDSGDGGRQFFIYSPSYPWRRRENEPKSEEEVHKIIIDTVQKICSMTADEIEEIIEVDIYEMGWG